MADVTVTVTGSQKMMTTLADGQVSVDADFSVLITLDDLRHANPVPPVDPVWASSFLAFANSLSDSFLPVAGKLLPYGTFVSYQHHCYGDGTGRTTPAAQNTYAFWFSDADGVDTTQYFAYALKAKSVTYEVTGNGPGAAGYHIALRGGQAVNHAASNSWHLLIVVAAENGGNVRIYLDGTKIMDATVSGFQDITGGVDIYAGRDPVIGGGMLGTCAFWTRQLSDAECIQLWTQTTFPP